MALLSVTPRRIKAKMRNSVVSNSLDFGWTRSSSINKSLNDAMKLGNSSKNDLIKILTLILDELL